MGVGGRGLPGARAAPQDGGTEGHSACRPPRLGGQSSLTPVFKHFCRRRVPPSAHGRGTHEMSSKNITGLVSTQGQEAMPCARRPPSRTGSHVCTAPSAHAAQRAPRSVRHCPAASSRGCDTTMFCCWVSPSATSVHRCRPGRAEGRPKRRTGHARRLKGKARGVTDPTQHAAPPGSGQTPQPPSHDCPARGRKLKAPSPGGGTAP